MLDHTDIHYQSATETDDTIRVAGPRGSKEVPGTRCREDPFEDTGRIVEFMNDVEKTNFVSCALYVRSLHFRPPLGAYSLLPTMLLDWYDDVSDKFCEDRGTSVTESIRATEVLSQFCGVMPNELLECFRAASSIAVVDGDATVVPTTRLTYGAFASWALGQRYL